jgi:hypothetical protein
MKIISVAVITGYNAIKTNALAFGIVLTVIFNDRPLISFRARKIDNENANISRTFPQ